MMISANALIFILVGLMFICRFMVQKSSHYTLKKEIASNVNQSVWSQLF